MGIWSYLLCSTRLNQDLLQLWPGYKYPEYMWNVSSVKKRKDYSFNFLAKFLYYLSSKIIQQIEIVFKIIFNYVLQISPLPSACTACRRSTASSTRTSTTASTAPWDTGTWSTSPAPFKRASVRASEPWATFTVFATSDSKFLEFFRSLQNLCKNLTELMWLQYILRSLVRFVVCNNFCAL